MSKSLRRLIQVVFALSLGATPTRATLNPASAVLTFAHTNDLHGRVISGLDFEDSSRGGLARAASLVRQIRTENPNVIFVDAGDLIHGSPVEFLSQGTSMIQAMNAAGIELSAPGNHEFDWGQANTKRIMELAQFQWLSANILDRANGQSLSSAQPFVIRQMGPVRVAFFGLTTLETVDLEWPPFIDQLRFEDPIAIAARLVPKLRQQADLVVVLSHLGALEDMHLAQAVPGIDVILGGHSHTVIDSRKELAGTQIAQTGYYGQYLGRLDLKMGLDPESGHWRLVDVNGRNGQWWTSLEPEQGKVPPASALIPLGPEVTPDPAVVSIYQPFWDQWKSMGFASLGIATAPITNQVAGQSAGGDTAVSRFLSDRLREATHSDLALIDGDWTGSIISGDLNTFELWSTMGGYTRQNILCYPVTGLQILQALDQYSQSPQSLAIGVSGLIAELNPLGPLGSRVLRAQIRGTPVDPSQTYQLAGIAYVLQRFPALIASAPMELSEPILWSRNLILDATRKLGHFSPDPVPRIVFQGVSSISHQP